MLLKDAPIQRKLTAIVLLTSGIVLLLTCIAFITSELVTFRRTLLDQAKTLSDAIAANSTTALTLKDEKIVSGILSALKADENILAAAIYDDNGRVFSTFHSGQAEAQIPGKPSADGHQFRSGKLVLFSPIKLEGQRLGTFYMESSLRPLYERLQLYAGIVAGILAVSLALVLLLSRWLQRSITRPIIELSETAKAISDQRNYLVRADKYNDDEIGKLTEAFNHMLAQIHERDLALLRNQERLKLALSASQTGIWDWEITPNRMTWDDFTHILFGLKRGTFGGTYEAFINLVHPQDRMTVIKAVEDTLKTGKELNVEFQVVWPDGSPHQIASRGKAIYDDGGRSVRMTGVCLDVSERKRQEEEIRTLNSELEHRVMLRTAELTASTREMEAFIYSVSHDLRAPLRHIIAFGEIMEDEFAPQIPDGARDYLGRITNGARSMSQLVDDLLNLARIGRQGVNREQVDLNSLINECIAGLNSETKQRKIEWKIATLPAVQGDPGLLRQVLMNLLSNALKYTRPREVAIIEIGHILDKGATAFFVRDNGVGFNMKFVDKLFGVFQRLHRADQFEGNGVGLATVERIITKHGGRVWAESELDKGATFYFTVNSETTILAKRPKEFPSTSLSQTPSV